MFVDPGPAAAPGGSRPGSGEGGFLLVMVMVVMLAVSAIAASTLINSFLERSLAKNQNYASIALQAAEAGLAAGSAWLRENQAAIPTTAPWGDAPPSYWQQSLTRTVFTDANDSTRQGLFTVRMRFKREWWDYNGNGVCTDPGERSANRDSDGDPATDCGQPLFGADIVLFNSCAGANNCFGYPAEVCPFNGVGANTGFPVIEISSTGYYGKRNPDGTYEYSSVREVTLDLARKRLNARGVNGAITAKGDVVAKGTVLIDGNNWTADGLALDSTCANMPGAFVENGKTAQAIGTADYVGTPAWEANPPVGDAGHREIYTTPWEALSIDEVDMPAPVTPATADYMLMNPDKFLGEIVYVTGAYNPPNGGQGILVVHNIAGDATMDIEGNYKFTGLIIADKVVIHGSADIIGAVLSMSTTEVDVSTGTPRIRYSCEAINGVTRQAYNNKLGWHRVR